MINKQSQNMQNSDPLPQKNQGEWHPNLWPPFTQVAIANPPNRVISGKGALLYTDSGSTLVDAISSWWVTLHGHSHPYISSAIAKQACELEQVIFADFIHPQAEKIAARLSKLTNLDRLFFSDNGSTAVEVALKIACQFWQNNCERRNQIIAFEGAYHGDTFGAMAVGERNLFNAPFEEMLFPVTRVPWPAYWWDKDNIDSTENQALEKLKSSLKQPTAAVILEPLIQGAGGMRMVRRDFIKEVASIVKESGALLIADEVLTGFGRCGKLFAFQRAGIKPDLVALSKGLTGGFLPMGVTLASEEIFQSFTGPDPQRTLWHGHSFTANPLGCAAANASLDLLEASPEIYENFESRHAVHLQALSKNPKIIKPRLIGTISAFELKVEGKSGYWNQAGSVIKQLAKKSGVFLRPLGNVVYLLPPLCITDEQLEQCYQAINRSLESL